MKITWTFTLMMIPGVVSVSVTGYSGGGIKCLCKDQQSNYFDLPKTNETDRWVDSGRFSLYENTRSEVLTVTIRDLSEEDSGTYYCAVDRPVEGDLYTEVKLEVITDDCCVKSISLSAAAGGSVNFSCKYPQSHWSDVKFLCRRSGADLCPEEQLLTGSISCVTEQDSEYWRGVQSDQGHKSFITRVRITVTDYTVGQKSI
ncbi:polymeric immunoglobulin receptor-like [Pseudorasbora parva]|uniref:polymeric immunoglobulin receptor-like n=1 Tax=Pseudorasbora parva TaxID=51549 RepID=UPI00351DBB2B